jgi:NAD-dependent dihydropyrimidine dehydrogenase PreA subunit
MREIPVLDETRCNGCGDCVGICPTYCLAMAGVVPWLIRPADCVSCAACVLVCPTEAIALQRPVPA